MSYMFMIEAGNNFPSFLFNFQLYGMLRNTDI